MPKVAPGTELKEQRIIIMMKPTEVDAIDDWSFSNRIRSRGEAIRQLCAYALEHKAKEGGAS